MAENTIKIRAKKSEGVTHVKTLIRHDMMSTQMNSDSARFIKEVKCEHNGVVVFKASWGASISKNPYLSFKFDGGNFGDNITISWVDSSGDFDNQTAIIG